MKFLIPGNVVRWLFLALWMIALPEMLLGQDGPDRDVSVGLVSPKTLASGEKIGIAVQVFNIGTESSDPTTIGYYVSSDITITTSDNVISTSPLGSLAAGSGFATNGSGTVSEPPGTYWVGACVDADPSDINPGNDCSAGVEISIPDIDLVTLSVTLSADRFPTGQSISFSTAVDNRGNETADPSTLRYKLSNNSSIAAGDSDITTEAIPALQGGERWLNDSGGTVIANPGTWWIGACADELPGESETSNNCSAGVEIEVLSDTLPDLVVSEVSANPSSWNPGAFIDFFAVVRNQGTAPSEATSIRFFISVDSTITESDTFLGTDNVPVRNSGQTVDTGIFLDPQLTPGNYWFGACVLTDGVEFITDNNCSAGVPVAVAENTNACSNLPISCGGNVSSNLSNADCDDSPRGTGYYAKRHTFEGGNGDEVIINAGFSGDGYLYLENPSGTVVAQNDDFDGSTNSRIDFTLNASGTWTIWTTTAETALDMSFELSLTCEALPEPDLTADLTQVTPQSISSTETLSLSATVSNEGSSSADATTLQYVVSSDSDISLLDPLLGTDDVASLGAGASIDLSKDVEGPAVPGTYWVGVCVDNVAGENAVENNCSAGTQITVNENTNTCADTAIACGETLSDSFDETDCDGSPRGPGYFARSYSFSASAGDNALIDADWSGDGYLYLEDPSGTMVAENDKADSDTSSQIVHTLDASGTWKIWTTSADAGGKLAFDLSLACEQAAQPDLTIETTEVSPINLTFGEPLSISTIVSNQGDGTSGASRVLFMVSNDSTLSPDDSVLRSSPVSALAPEETSSQSVALFALISEGTHWIGACVVEVAGEVDVTNNCSNTVAITVLGTGTIPFVSGLNDSWFSPLTNGQGFFINVFPELKQIFLSWFTYEVERPDDSVPANLGEPGHRWLTAQGSYDSNLATLDVYVTEGGVFNASPPVPVTHKDGQIQLAFSSCAAGVVSYDITSLGLHGEVVIERLGPDNISLCEEQVAAVTQGAGETAELQSKPDRVAPEAGEDFVINPGLNDAWFYPATNGQGFFINVFPDTGRMFLSWFTYDTERPDEAITAQLGEPGHRWLTALGPYAGNKAALEVFIADGGVFDDSPPEPVQEQDGTIEVEFTDCETGVVKFNIPSINQTGQVPIQRLTPDNVPLCEQLNAEAQTE